LSYWYFINISEYNSVIQITAAIGKLIRICVLEFLVVTNSHQLRN